MAHETRFRPIVSRRARRAARGAAGLLGAMGAFLLLILLMAGPALADIWTDISDAQWQEDYAITAQQADVVADGFPDGTFRPYEEVTRGQFTKMAVDGLGIDTFDPPIPSFSDVPRIHPLYVHIEGGAAAELIGGYPDGTFRPDDLIRREQGFSLLANALSAAEIDVTGGIEGDAATYPSVAAWYAAEGEAQLVAFSDAADLSPVHRVGAAYLTHREVLQGGGGRLDPGGSLSRAQAVALVVRTSVIAAAFVGPPPLAPTELAVVPAGPAHDARPRVTGSALAGGSVTIYDTFGGATTAVAEGTAGAGGGFSMQVATLTEGEHHFTATVEDGEGLVSPPSTAVAYLLDETDPVATITEPAAATIAFTDSRQPDLSAEAVDPSPAAGIAASGVADVEFGYRLLSKLPAPPGSWTMADFLPLGTTDGPEYAADWDDVSLLDGRYVFAARALDVAGNAGALDTQQVVVDTQAPKVTIASPESGDRLLGGENALIAWTATDVYLPAEPVRIEYSLDDGDHWILLAAATDNDGTYAWAVPADDVDVPDVWVRVSVVDGMGRVGRAVAGPLTIDNTPAPPPPPVNRGVTLRPLASAGAVGYVGPGGADLAVTATVYDQFGHPMPNVNVYFWGKASEGEGSFAGGYPATQWPGNPVKTDALGRATAVDGPADWSAWEVWATAGGVTSNVVARYWADQVDFEAYEMTLKLPPGLGAAYDGLTLRVRKFGSDQPVVATGVYDNDVLGASLSSSSTFAVDDLVFVEFVGDPLDNDVPNWIWDLAIASPGP